MLGIATSAKSLSSLTAQLPEIDLIFPPHILGQSTIENVQSGILNGAIASIEGLITKLKNEVFPNEEIIVELYSIDELKKMVRENKIIQSMHVTCILYALEKIGELSY
jgi:pantothenate kinase type III